MSCVPREEERVPFGLCTVRVVGGDLAAFCFHRDASRSRVAVAPPVRKHTNLKNACFVSELEVALTEMDTNGDGVVSLREFLEWRVVSPSSPRVPAAPRVSAAPRVPAAAPSILARVYARYLCASRPPPPPLLAAAHTFHVRYFSFFLSFFLSSASLNARRTQGSDVAVDDPSDESATNAFFEGARDSLV
jgi:hypothetical protein